MTNSMSVFAFNSNEVRTFADSHNEMWFCAKDVCKVLGYSNDSKAIKDHCKDRGVTKRYLGVVTGKKANGEDSIQEVEMSFINEPNLYRLIVKSRKPEAEAFEALVMEEILPTIRKTGSYSAPERKTKHELTAEQKRAIQKTVDWIVKTRGVNNTTKFATLCEYLSVVYSGEFIAAAEAPTIAPAPAQTFTINRTDDWHTNFQQGQEAVNAIRLSVCTGDAKLLDKVKYSLRNAQAQIYKIDFCGDGISTGYIDMITRYAIIGMQACNTPLVANRI